MRVTQASLRIIFFSPVLFLFGLAPAALAQDQTGKWGIGVRVGPSFLTQDFASGISSDLGPIVSGNILYSLDNLFSLGLNIEWDTHIVGAIDLKRIKTISLLPSVEIHPVRSQALSPYASLGAGLNINSFDLVKNFEQSCPFLLGGQCTADTEYTFAAKVGMGVDYFVTESLALNAEAGWKYNSGSARLKVNGATISSADFDSSVFSILLGLRYYF